jgi:hypothetical protein
MRLHKFFRWPAWLSVVLISAFTLSPIEARPVTGYPADLERFVAFAMLGGVFGLAYPRQRIRLCLLVVGLAGGLEFAQHLFPGRHGLIHDGALKASAAVAGLAVATMIDHHVQRS